MVYAHTNRQNIQTHEIKRIYPNSEVRWRVADGVISLCHPTYVCTHEHIYLHRYVGVFTHPHKMKTKTRNEFLALLTGVF